MSGFALGGGEDVDLGIRLHKQGCEFYLIDSIETIHYPHHKDPREKQLSAKYNIEYICNKFTCAEVDLLRQHSWFEILMKTKVIPEKQKQAKVDFFVI